MGNVMSKLETAISLASAVHNGQKDKQEQPYILHPLRVMLSVVYDPLEFDWQAYKENEETLRIVAVLHDTIKDCGKIHWSKEGMMGQVGQFGKDVLRSILALTRNENEPYSEYVIRCKKDEYASTVKIADLKDNSRIDRSVMQEPKGFEATREVFPVLPVLDGSDHRGRVSGVPDKTAIDLKSGIDVTMSSA